MARFTAALTLCLASSATAFVTPSARRTPVRQATTMKVEGLVGDTAPFGYWDPLGFSQGKSLEQMTSYREAELKHGRIAMAATLGWIAQPGFHPLAKDCHIKTPTDPIKTLYELPPAGFLQIFIFIGFLEFLGLKIKENPTYAAGDLLGASELVDNTDAGWVDYQQKELNNGRLAMFAIMGFWIQDLIFGKTGDLLFAPMVQ
eukprot:CAMPEP_0119479206 /NCGR_PEP_ID=MMETSP1344-20130328/8579_1 /TAXON_ID=236787 /ORGANISM="Florenciella parvula, Strain CCMP2471" /LENGTH=201 /DNA_ID=CAMNT_0007513423 /DNA_START=43 /DNA_END=648 /DNA_ORIENTATION=+